MTRDRMPFPGRYPPSDALLVSNWRQHISHLMASFVAKYACCNNVIEALSSAVHSWLQMFRGATETVEQSDREMVTLRHQPLVSIPHRKVAVEASPILPLCLCSSKFYQSVCFAHFAHPLLHQHEADVQQP